MSADRDDIDALLRLWAEARAPSAARLDELRARTAAAVERVEPAGRPATAERPALGPRLAWAALAAAVVLGIAVGVSVRWRDRVRPMEVGSRSEDPPPFAQLEQPRLQNQRRLIGELDRLFDDRVAWVAETDGRVWIGLESAGAKSDPPTLAVRVVVARRADGGWSPVWSADFVARDQWVVRITHESNGRADLSVWAYLLPDGLVALESRLDLDGPHSLRSRSSGVQRPGIPEAVPLAEADEEYRVFQTVAVLDHERS